MNKALILIAALALAALPTTEDYDNYKVAVTEHSQALDAEIVAFEALQVAETALAEAQMAYDDALDTYDAAKDDTDIALIQLNAANEACRPTEP